MDTPQRVYCSNCKYMKDEGIAGFTHYVCKHKNNSSIAHTPLYCYTKHEECDDVNANNDCKLFSPSIWYRFLKKLGYKNCEDKE